MKKWQWILFLVLSTTACKKNNSTLILQEVIFPSKTKNSITPNLYLSPQGNLMLSWVELNQDTSTLLYSKLENNKWSEPKTAASGTGWFVNWADFPSMTTYPSSELSVLAQYLEKRDTADPYHYDIKLAISRDGGEHFKATNSLQDSLVGEHGFVSMIPYSFDQVLAIWLDGGAQAASALNSGAHDQGHGPGAMQLRSALVDFDGKIKNAQLVDGRVCDCCQTDACMTAKGPILVYRNRSEDEIRDIYYTRYIEGSWTEPKSIHDDHWKINGCPVNGPAIAALGNQVATVWYTEINGKPKIQFVHSENAANTFSEPIEIQTKHTPGRVDIVWIDEDHLAISYLDKKTAKSDEATVKLTIYSIQQASMQTFDIDQISSKRASGFPILEKCINGLYLAYTLILEHQHTSIKTIQLTIVDDKK